MHITRGGGGKKLITKPFAFFACFGHMSSNIHASKRPGARSPCLVNSDPRITMKQISKTNLKDNDSIFCYWFFLCFLKSEGLLDIDMKF